MRKLLSSGIVLEALGCQRICFGFWQPAAPPRATKPRKSFEWIQDPTTSALAIL